MKEINIIIRPEKLEMIKSILDAFKCGGITVYSVMGCGTQRGHVDEAVQNIRDHKVQINLLPKIKVECVVADEKVEDIIVDIRHKVFTDAFGDGKIFIKPVDDAVRIRTGERGDKAL